MMFVDVIKYIRNSEIKGRRVGIGHLEAVSEEELSESINGVFWKRGKQLSYALG